MPPLTVPNRVSNLPLAPPSTPRGHYRYLGLLVVATLLGTLAAGAWYLAQRTPPMDNGSPGVFQRP
jgi:hypothetical protein